MAGVTRLSIGLQVHVAQDNNMYMCTCVLYSIQFTAVVHLQDILTLACGPLNTTEHNSHARAHIIYNNYNH